MLKVLTAEQMREVDRLTTERYGIPSIILMENAAHAVARVITEKLGGSVRDRRILILCGKGNNGGDGAALARILAAEEAFVNCFLIGKVDKTRGDARTNFEILQRTTCDVTLRDGDKEKFRYHRLWFEEVESIREWVAEYRKEPDPDCVVDALFGTGLAGELGRDYEKIFDTSWFRRDLQRLGRPVLRIAIDIPSGLLSDTNLIAGPHSTADVTVTFTSPKLANVLPEASHYHGELIVADISSPPILVDLTDSNTYVSAEAETTFFLERIQFERSSYKNKRGHALIVAGSADYSGAAVLAGNAAMRSGVGLVTLVCPADAKSEVASRLMPEVILTTIESGGPNDHVEKADVIAVGCGLDASDESVGKLVREIIAKRKVPVIADAGALSFMPEILKHHTKLPPADARRPHLILTPHEGEFLQLLGTEDKEVIRDRVQAVRDFAQANGVILVLKGERVLIGHPDGRVVANPTGNSGLGKAGNGDTLTGIIAGFLAQAVKMETDVFETVVAAVYVAGMAGDVAEEKYGKRVMTASDVRECMTEVFAKLGGSR